MRCADNKVHELLSTGNMRAVPRMINTSVLFGDIWNSSVLKWYFNQQNTIPLNIRGVAEDFKAYTWECSIYTAGYLKLFIHMCCILPIQSSLWWAREPCLDTCSSDMYVILTLWPLVCKEDKQKLVDVLKDTFITGTNKISTALQAVPACLLAAVGCRQGRAFRTGEGRVKRREIFVWATEKINPEFGSTF